MKKLMQPVPAVKAECFEQYRRIRFGMSTRIGGVSPWPLGLNLSLSVGDDERNVHRNRMLFFGGLGIGLDDLAIPKQVHSTNVSVAESAGSYPECDALVTGKPGVFLCVSVADCVPVFLFDKERLIVAAIHAGWRGTANGIVSKTLSLIHI